MVLDQDIEDRDEAVRAMLVARVQRSAREPASLADALSGPLPARSRARFTAGAVTAVVLVLVIALSAVAVRLGIEDRSAPAYGGLSSRSIPFVSTSPASIPSVSTPAGVVLGRWTSADGTSQTHTIHPNGLALSYRFSCTGPGPYRVSLSHDSEEAGDQCSGGGGGYGSKGHSGPVTIAIRAPKTARWSFVVVGIPETYVTPKPVLTPKDAAGVGVPFCDAGDLTARFETVRQHTGVTEVRGGQLVLTNASSTTCALAGWPGVRFLDSGTALGSHTMKAIDQRSSTDRGLRPVLVGPGGKAYSQIGWYLPNYYPENEVGPCQERTVHAVRVDLANAYAGAAQNGSFDVPVGTVTACLNSPWGVYGKYGQVSSTVFVDYSAEPGS